LPRGSIPSGHHLSFVSQGHGSKATPLLSASNPSNNLLLFLLLKTTMMISSFDNDKPWWEKKMKRKFDQEKEDASIFIKFLVIIYTKAKVMRFLGSWV
jgi:hypothetical protein